MPQDNISNVSVISQQKKNSESFQLRPYQRKAIADVVSELKKGNATLLVSPTGAGKTVIAAKVAEKYDHVVVVAHRKELLDQAAENMRRYVQILSIQSVLKYGPSSTQLLIIDEAHRANATTYRKIIKKYSDAARLGLTATPLRTDGRGLKDAFDVIVEASDMIHLREQKYLVPYRAFEGSDMDLAKLAKMRKRGGDYDPSALSELMNRPRLLGNAVDEYRKHALGRKAIAFAVSIDHSKALTEAFNAQGIRTAHLDGRASRSVREDRLASLRDGRIDVLCNVNLFTEGWDCPEASCVIMARPTTSTTLYLQCVGRGMRPSEGKSDLVILDHAGNIERLGAPELDRQWSLEGVQEKKKRESEIAELERLHALGFDSIEAELEERRRIIENSYHSKQVARILKPFFDSAKLGRNFVSDILSRRGIRPVSRSGHGGSFYDKTEISQLVSALTDSYTTTDCREIFKSFTRSQISTFLRLADIAPSMGLRGRYPKPAVDELKSLLDSSYTSAECCALLPTAKNALSTYLRKRGVQPIKRGSAARYRKSDIDRLITSNKGAVVSTEAAAMQIGITVYVFNRLVSRKIIKPINKIGRVSMFSVQSIEALERRFRDSYSAAECINVLGLRWPNAFYELMESRGIAPIFGDHIKHRKRWPKADIDRLAAELKASNS